MSADHEVEVQWRVLRGDGVAVPLAFGASGSEEGARLTFAHRQKHGQRGPYKTQSRTVTTSQWADTGLPPEEDPAA